MSNNNRYKITGWMSEGDDKYLLKNNLSFKQAYRLVDKYNLTWRYLKVEEHL